MADTTAWILVGPGAQSFGSDHFDPTHLLTLSENDRAAWNLSPLGDQPARRVTWVPASPESLVHDAMLLVSIHVFEDEQLLELASRAIPDIKAQRLDLNMPDRSSELAPLYERCRGLRWSASIVVTVLSHSSLNARLQDFGQYSLDVRTCLER